MSRQILNKLLLTGLIALCTGSGIYAGTSQMQSVCATNPAFERRVIEVTSGIDHDSPLDQAIAAGMRGDGIHHSWMDKMKDLGVREASASVSFTWNSEGAAHFHVTDLQYFRAYSDSESRVPLSGAADLRHELERFVLDRAEAELTHENLKQDGFHRAFGTVYVQVFDDECLPVLSPLPQICDGDETALMRRIMRGESNAELFGVDSAQCKDPQDPDADRRDPKELIAAGEDVNAKNHQGYTALMMTAATDYGAAARLLLESGAKIEEQNFEGATALSEAARFCDTDIVEALLARGANPSTPDRFGETPLMKTASCPTSFPEVLRPLHRAGADLNARNHKGETALLIAVDLGNAESVQSLLKLGADPNIHSNTGDSALSIATRKGFENVVSILKDAGAR